MCQVSWLPVFATIFYFDARIEAWISKTNALAVAGASNSGEIVAGMQKLG
jgi:hypothetical protein